MQNSTKKILRTAIVSLALTISITSVMPTAVLAQKQAVDTSAPTGINSTSDLVQWMTYYYLHPQPDLLVPAMVYADSKGLTDQGQAPLMAFLSRVFAQNPDRINGWAQQLSALSSKSRPVLWSALWWSNTLPGKQALTNLMQTMPEQQQAEVMAQMAKPAVAIETMELKSPEVLDELWGAWSATGDPKYVNRLMTALPWASDASGDYVRLSIGGAARWSLSSNAATHPKVLQIVMKARETQPELRKVLDQVIADATKSSPNQQASTHAAQ